MTKRLTAVVLLLAVVLAGVLVLRPTETTLAAWSNEVTVEVPSLQTGGVRMEVTPARSGTAARVGLAGEATGTWRPVSVRVEADGRALTPAELAGSRLEYRLAGGNGSCPTSGAAAYTAQLTGSSGSFAVTGGERLSGQRTLCLTFVPSDQVRIQLGGQALSLTTTIDGATTAPATWTATGSWAVTHQLGPGPSVDDLRCADGSHNRWLTLSWSWDRADLSQDVSSWSVQVKDGDTWREVRTISRPQTMSITLGIIDFSWVERGTYTLRTAAVLKDGTQIPSETTTQLRAQRFLIFGSVSCVR